MSIKKTDVIINLIVEYVGECNGFCSKPANLESSFYFVEEKMKMKCLKSSQFFQAKIQIKKKSAESCWQKIFIHIIFTLKKNNAHDLISM